MSTRIGASGWTRFWDRGGWWKASALLVVYLAAYLGFGFLLGSIAGEVIDTGDLFGDPMSVFLALALPEIFGAVVLLGFAASVGWLPRPLLGRQPVRGSWWMWLAPALVAVTIVLRLLGIEWSSYGVSVIIVTFLAGIFIGLSEELLTRGLVVTFLRRHGYNEWVVAALSSLAFAVMHSANLLSGQPPFVVLVTVGFAFGFGVMMYLTMRVTGNLVWPILLHALTDPTTILATGGIDVEGTDLNPLLTLAGGSSLVFLVFAVVAVIFIRGHAHGRAAVGELEPMAATPDERRS